MKHMYFRQDGGLHSVPVLHQHQWVLDVLMQDAFLIKDKQKTVIKTRIKVVFCSLE